MEGMFGSVPGDEQQLITDFSRYYMNSLTWAGGVTWEGIRCEKYPQDLWLYQQIIFERKPDFIVETGTQHGGTAFFMARLCEWFGKGRVYTIDVRASLGIRPHPLLTVLTMDSAGAEARAFVAELLKKGEQGMVILDSDHATAHVEKELEIYSPLVGQGQSLIVEDTQLHILNKGVWKEHDPTFAVEPFLKAHPGFIPDPLGKSFVLSMSPGGYLVRAA